MAGVRPLKADGWSGHLTAVALAAFLTYFNTLGNGFVLDDFGLILFLLQCPVYLFHHPTGVAFGEFDLMKRMERMVWGRSRGGMEARHSGARSRADLRKPG